MDVAVVGSYSPLLGQHNSRYLGQFVGHYIGRVAVAYWLTVGQELAVS